MFLNEEFLKLYEELSMLHEGVKSQATLKNIIGCKNGQLVLDLDGTSGKPSLLDFVDIDATKALNPTIADNAENWIISTAVTQGAFKYVFKCPNPNCRNPEGKTYSMRGSVIRSKKLANPLLSQDSSAYDLALCKFCRSKLKDTSTRLDWTMENVGGCRDGEPIKATETTGSLFDYLDIEASIKATPHLAEQDPKEWSPFDYYCTYCFKCSNCDAPISKTGATFNNHVRLSTDMKYHKNSAKEFLLCTMCQRRQSRQINDIPELWNRLPEWLFKDKSSGAEAILSERGRQELYRLNKNNPNAPKIFISCLLNKNNDFKVAAQLKASSQVIVPLKCTSPNCGFEYTTSLYNAYSSNYFSCPACIDSINPGSQTSASEIFLRETIKKLFKVDTISTPKIGRFKKIDILFKYNNDLIGIEYDGGRFHKDAAVIIVDEAKTVAYSNNYNIKFIRVRESGCAQFNSELAYIIDVKPCFINLTKNKYFDCIEAICEYLGYVLTTEDRSMLLDLYKNRHEVVTTGQQKNMPIDNNQVKSEPAVYINK